FATLLIEDGHIGHGYTDNAGSKILERNEEAILGGAFDSDRHIWILSQHRLCESNQEDQCDCGTDNEFHGLCFQGLRLGLGWAVLPGPLSAATGVIYLVRRRQDQSGKFRDQLGVLLIGQHRLEARFHRTFRQLHPRAATSVARQVWKNPTRSETKSAHERHVHPRSVIVIETLAHNRLLQNVQRLERRDYFPRSDFLHRNRPGEKLNLDFARAFLWDFRVEQARLPELLVKERREKEKLRMPEGEPGAALGDSTFAQNHALVAAAHRLAHDGPLF